MNWYLYKKDDPNTWPEIDCPMLIYKDEFNSLHLWKWNNELKKFMTNDTERVLHYCKECYYQYIGYVPDGYKEIKTQKCSCIRKCEYEDDGYCLDAPEGKDCIFCEEVTEYSLNDNKRIWKDFN